ncbi:MAG: amidohydrolase family protein, partial [Pseudomonadota bacterium]
EVSRLARSGAVVGLCPITESSLGDGIFRAVDYRQHGGQFAVGSDSNIRVSLAEELRTLEYSQRLRDRGRAVLADPGESTARSLFEAVLAGGTQACGRDSGVIRVGAWADLLALDTEAVDAVGRSQDLLLDSFVFARGDRMVQDLWSAGRHLVREGRHILHDELTARYRATLQTLMAAL